ncbi:MAG: hypothetical protein HOP13_01860 [Alphaproteobacteria bacterium]|nr:hypothetical protein [Alphaproteobacteria bacterium]
MTKIPTLLSDEGGLFDLDTAKWEDEKHNRERETMFTFEGFALGVNQTVSAAGLLGLVTQFDNLVKITGPFPPRIGITLFALALTCSVYAALFRYFYKMWDVKARARDDGAERKKRLEDAAFYLKWTRELMGAATLLIVAALLFAVVAMWFFFLFQQT